MKLSWTSREKIDLPRAEAVYTVLPGWKRDISNARLWSDLPEACRNFIKMLVFDHTLLIFLNVIWTPPRLVLMCRKNEAQLTCCHRLQNHIAATIFQVCSDDVVGRFSNNSFVQVNVSARRDSVIDLL